MHALNHLYLSQVLCLSPLHSHQVLRRAVIQLCVKTRLSKGLLRSGLRNKQPNKRGQKLNLEIQTALSGLSMEGEAPGIGALFSRVSSLKPLFFFFTFYFSSQQAVKEERDVVNFPNPWLSFTLS